MVRSVLFKAFSGLIESATMHLLVIINLPEAQEMRIIFFILRYQRSEKAKEYIKSVINDEDGKV